MRSVVTRLRETPVEPDANTDAIIDLEEMLAAIDELPSIDATKLVSLHRRIMNEDYRIDTQRLAEKLIDLEAALDAD